MRTRRTTRRRTLPALAVAVAAVAAGAGAHASTPEAPRAVTGAIEVTAEAPSDRALATTVADRVFRSLWLSIFDHVEVASQGSVVTLTGKVTMGFKAEEFEQIARATPGVREVRNEIRAFQVSTGDDRIRGEVARRVYRLAGFTKYAIQRDPPIHVVVEGGRVTLVGVVQTPLERLQAESAARGVFGVLSVENRLRLERELASSTS